MNREKKNYFYYKRERLCQVMRWIFFCHFCFGSVHLWYLEKCETIILKAEFTQNCLVWSKIYRSCVWCADLPVPLIEWFAHVNGIKTTTVSLIGVFSSAWYRRVLHIMSTDWKSHLNSINLFPCHKFWK